LLPNANGKRLIRDVIDRHGRVLIAAGNVLWPELVSLLAKHKIAAVWVKDDETEKVNNHEIWAVDDLVDEQTRLTLMDGLQQTLVGNKKLTEQLEVMKVGVLQIVEELSRRQDLLLYLNDIRGVSNYLYKHSVNVSILAIALGLTIGLTKDEVYLLGMGGLLHDLGKMRIDPAILDKRGPLTVDEFKQVKEHTIIGYNMLRLETQLDPRIALIALQHHEYSNGMGYPWGIVKNDIHPFSRIIAICDVFDALTTDRAYRSRMPARAAMKIITAGSDQQFDGELVEAFRKVAVIYNIGCRVKLSNGLYGEVAGLNSADASRPIVATKFGLINLFYKPELDIVEAI